MQDFSEKSIFPLGRGTVVLSAVLCGFIVNGSVDLLLLITSKGRKFSSAHRKKRGGGGGGLLGSIG